MKFVVNAFLSLSVAILAAFTISSVDKNSDAIAAYGSQSALMVIKFNQPNVSYQDQLFYVVSQAVKAKQTVIFDVVSVTPDGKGVYGQQVADDIKRIGVNPLQVTYRTEAGRVNSEEVRIFVR